MAKYPNFALMDRDDIFKEIWDQNHALKFQNELLKKELNEIRAYCIRHNPDTYEMRNRLAAHASDWENVSDEKRRELIEHAVLAIFCGN